MLSGSNSEFVTGKRLSRGPNANAQGFKTIQDLANGAKHFIRKQDVQTRHVGGFGMGPYGVGPYGASYLLIDYGADAGAERWKTARELLECAVTFWNGFFDKHCPTERQA
jgi:hypothetical protein